MSSLAVRQDLSIRQAALKKIAQEIGRCKECRRGKSGLPVPGEGAPNAKIVFLGEAPGKNEAKTGRPFIGRAGKLLRSLINEAGLKEEDVYITSPVKYLPDYVTPTPKDILHGVTHLSKQLEVIQPKMIVLLGRVAALAMMQENISFVVMHGTVREKDGRKYFISYHPAAPLYSPKLRSVMKEDFVKLKKLIKKI